MGYGYGYGYGGWAPYVSVAERRRRAMKKMDALRKKGVDIQPVEIDGRKIAKSFWGEAWCDHLESFSDFENRLPRGRTYVRNGSVCHLAVAKGSIEAKVSGSELYTVKMSIKTLPGKKWKSLKGRCSGQIGSLLELLQGRLSDHVMEVVTDRKEGLFPLPGEMSFTLQLSRLGRDVQARRRRALRRRGAAGHQARVALCAARREPRGIDRGRRREGRGGGNVPREVQAACGGRDRRSVRHRPGLRRVPITRPRTRVRRRRPAAGVPQSGRHQPPKSQSHKTRRQGATGANRMTTRSVSEKPVKKNVAEGRRKPALREFPIPNILVVLASRGWRQTDA